MRPVRCRGRRRARAGGSARLALASGAEVWTGTPDQAAGAVHNPVIVGDTVYVVDGSGLLALQAP